jgi:hyperosmotically inducible protein
MKINKTLAVTLALGALTATPAFAADTQPGTVQHDADNTERNVRDRDSKALTPMDQSENEADRTITQRIRKAVVADDSLSTNAKNVKIITNNGVVTLRGPVKSAQEKTKIVATAHQVAGASKVDDQLEVEANK